MSKRLQITFSNTPSTFIEKLVSSGSLYLVNDLEIEPFNSFSDRYAAIYWHTKFYLLQNGQVEITGDLLPLFQETEVNIIWLTVTDDQSFKISCVDGGDWYLEFINTNLELEKMMSAAGIKIKPAANNG